MTAEDLKKLGACQEAIDWLGERTVEEAWLVCEGGWWMRWLLGRLGCWFMVRRPVYLILQGRSFTGAQLADAIRAVCPQSPKP